MKKIISLINLIIALICLADSGLAKVSAVVNNKNIDLQQIIQLTVTTDKAIDSPPDFKQLLNNFTIISQSHAMQTSVINGKVSKSISWQLALLPKKVGKLVIPKIKLSGDYTDPITIQVAKVSSTINQKVQANEEVFLKVTSNSSKTYPNSAIKIAVKIFYADQLQIRDAALIKPQVSHGKWVELTSEQNHNYLHGKLYHVLAKKYLLFIDKPGKYNINGFILKGSYAKQLVTDNFFEFPNYQPLVKASNQLNLAIIDQPVGWQTKPWIATNKLTLTQNWLNNKSAYKVGDAITRIIKLQLVNNYAEQLPNWLTNSNNSLYKVYADPAKRESKLIGDDLITTITQNITYIFTKDGQAVLPEINFAWWDLANDQSQIAKLVGKQLNIAAAAPISTHNTNNSPSKVVNSSTAISSNHNLSKMMLLISVVIFCLSIVILYYALTKNKRHHRQSNQAAKQQSLSVIKNQLKKACLANDSARVKDNLLAWGQLSWPEQKITGLNQLATNLPAELQPMLVELDRYLYASKLVNDDLSWSSGKKLWKVVKLIFHSK